MTFDNFVVAGMTSMDYRTYLADELKVGPENPNPRSTKKPTADEWKLPYETFAQNQNLKHSSKTFVQSPQLNRQLLIQTVILFSNFPNFEFPLLCWFSVNIIISSGFDLLKQLCFPLARKNSQIENFFAN